MQTHFLLQPNNFRLFDFCEQCACFHQAYFSNGALVMAPCENQIHQTIHDEKFLTETNFTLPNTQSTNSISCVSIKDHLTPSSNTNFVRPRKPLNQYFLLQPIFQPYQITNSSKSLSRPRSALIENFSPQKTTLSQLQTKNKISSQPLTPNFYMGAENRKNTLFQNSQPIQMSRNNLPYNRAIAPLPIIYAKNNQSCLQTPHFGSQSRISPSKQNSVNAKVPNENKKQPHASDIIDNRVQRTASQVQEESDYFCCGYIRKCDK